MRYLVILLILSTLTLVVHGGSKKPKPMPGKTAEGQDKDVAAGMTSNVSTTATPTMAVPTAPPETINARKISNLNWVQLTGGKEIYVSDPDFFRDMVQPLADHAIFLNGAGLMAGNMIVNSNSTNSTSDMDDDVNDTDNESTDNSVDPGNTKRDVNDNQIVPKAKMFSGNFGIYLTTGIIVAICIIGLFSIFCVARANGQRARDYEIGNRRGPRRSGAGLTPASGWRRSQDYLNEESNALQDRSTVGGSQLYLNQQTMAGSQLNLSPQVMAGSQLNLHPLGTGGSQLNLHPQGIPMNRIENDVTDV